MVGRKLYKHVTSDFKNKIELTHLRARIDSNTQMVTNVNIKYINAKVYIVSNSIITIINDNKVSK